MSKRWQTALTPLVEGRHQRPGPEAPRGYAPAKGLDGDWCPVGMDSGHVLWRRVVTKATQRRSGAPQGTGATKGLPAWCGGSEDLARATTDIVDAIAWPSCDRGESKSWPPRRGRWAAKGDASSVLALWRSLDEPDLADFVRDARLVAWAARTSGDNLFAHDVRGEGWQGGKGTDRSRSVQTLTVQTRWTERVRVARREWKERQQRQQRQAEPSELPSPMGG